MADLAVLSQCLANFDVAPLRLHADLQRHDFGYAHFGAVGAYEPPVSNADFFGFLSLFCDRLFRGTIFKSFGFVVVQKLPVLHSSQLLLHKQIQSRTRVRFVRQRHPFPGNLVHTLRWTSPPHPHDRLVACNIPTQHVGNKGSLQALYEHLFESVHKRSGSALLVNFLKIVTLSCFDSNGKLGAVRAVESRMHIHCVTLRCLQLCLVPQGSISPICSDALLVVGWKRGDQPSSLAKATDHSVALYLKARRHSMSLPSLFRISSVLHTSDDGLRALSSFSREHGRHRLHLSQ